MRLAGEARQPLLLDPEHVEQLGVPARAGEVEQPRARGEREARFRLPAEEAGVEVVGERDEAGGAAKHLRLRLREPGELGGPEARVDGGAGARVHGFRVGTAPQPRRGARALGVTPAEERRQSARKSQ